MPGGTIVVSGMMAGDPHQGGATWAVLQYVLGLERLGHEVRVIEPVETLEPESVAYFDAVVVAFGLEGRAALVQGGERLPLLERADVLLNISGMLRGEVESIPIRVYLDLDPAFNQLWHAQGVDVGLEGHTHYASVGHRVPRTGHDWIHTLPPVVLERWPVSEAIALDALTTVGNWRSYGRLEHDGVRYGQKAHSLRRFLDLPRRSDERFALALAIHPDERDDLAALAENGWELLDPREVAGTPAAYQAFVQGSKAELGIAKEGYVVSQCGWFSDRSACYLASGRPVIAQDTGFGASLPTGAGLFAFDSTDDVLAAVEELRRDYGRHARAARAIAKEFLDSDRVLSDLLRAVGALPASPSHSVHEAEEGAIAAALGRPVARLERRPFAYRSSSPMAELDITFADGSSASLLLKDLGRQGLGTRPAFLRDPRREIDVYRSVLAGEHLDTAELYGAVVEPERDRYWLLIEKVPGVELYQVDDLGVWEDVMRWLARLHERFAGRTLPSSLLRYDDDLLRVWLERAVDFGRIDGLRGYDEVAERLASLPATFLHGELYASQVLVSDGRICPIDWEMAASGPAVLDVAAITAGWDDAVQERLVSAYLDELASPPDPSGFARDLDCARLQLALQWLGWAADWQPPPEHEQDWLAQVPVLAGRLGL